MTPPRIISTPSVSGRGLLAIGVSSSAVAGGPRAAMAPRTTSIDVRTARAGIVAAAAVHHRPGTLEALAVRFCSWDPVILGQAVADAQAAGLLTVAADGTLDVREVGA